MKVRPLAVMMLLGLLVGLGFAALVTQTAAAACYDQSKQPIPCDKEKNAKPTPVPATPTDTPVPTAPAPVGSGSAVVNAPSALSTDQLKALCAALPAVQGGNTSLSGNNTVGGGGGPGTPATPPSKSGFLPSADLEFGGGGILLGVLIGLLLPAVKRGWAGPITKPGGANFNGDGLVQDGTKHFPKMGDANFPKLTNMGKDKIGGLSTGQGEAAAAVDMFHKADPSIKLDDTAIKKLDGTTWDKRGVAGMADGSVRNFGSSDAHMEEFHQSGNEFGKSSDAGITDGSSINGDG